MAEKIKTRKKEVKLFSVFFNISKYYITSYGRHPGGKQRTRKRGGKETWKIFKIHLDLEIWEKIQKEGARARARERERERAETYKNFGMLPLHGISLEKISESIRTTIIEKRGEKENVRERVGT